MLNSLYSIDHSVYGIVGEDGLWDERNVPCAWSEAILAGRTGRAVRGREGNGSRRRQGRGQKTRRPDYDELVFRGEHANPVILRIGDAPSRRRRHRHGKRGSILVGDQGRDIGG